MSAIPAAIQSLLTLLASCGCSSSHRHVVSVHHGDGSVERHPSAAPVPDTTLLRWKLFPQATKPILKMKFNELRSEATRTMKHFVNDPIPWPKANTGCFCSVPELWMASVPVASLPLSKVAILKYHGLVSEIRLQDILPWAQIQPFKTNPKDSIRLATRNLQKSFLISIVEVSRSIIGRTKENGHIELPEVTFETMRQCDVVFGDWQSEEEDDNEEEDDIIMLVDDAIPEHGQDEEDEWDGPYTQPDPVSPTSLSPAPVSPAPKSPAPVSPPATVSPPAPVCPPATVSPATWAQGLTSIHITPVLAGYLLDSSLVLHLLPSYLQVVFHEHLQIWLSDGVSTIKASLAPDLLEELSGVRLLHSVISVVDSTGHAGAGDLVLVNLSCFCTPSL